MDWNRLHKILYDSWDDYDTSNPYFPRGPFCKFHAAIIPFMFGLYPKWPQILFFDSRTSTRQFRNTNRYPLVLPSLQVVTARNILGGSPPGYELNEKKIFTREERFNKIYVPVEHPEGYTNACKWGVIFRLHVREGTL